MAHDFLGRFTGKFPVATTENLKGVDKTRNMEHSGTFRNMPEHAGTFRNIPEHPGTWKNKNNFHEN